MSNRCDWLRSNRHDCNRSRPKRCDLKRPASAVNHQPRCSLRVQWCEDQSEHAAIGGCDWRSLAI
eukprot:563748-Alexandrium_andersonii.AAC.1